MRKTLKRGAAFCLAAMMALTACDAKSGNSGETGGQAAETKAQTQAEEKNEVRHLTLAAVASSSGLFPYCVSIGKVLSTLPELDITVSESGGNVDNTQQLRAGEISIANSISNTDYESYTGTGSTFKEPFKDFRILWYYESSPIQICVAKDTGIASLEDLEGQTFNPGGTGTAASVVTHEALDVLGIKPEYFEAAQADAADAYSNRQIVGAVKTGPFPDSYVMQLNTNRPIQMINIPDEQLNTILEAIPSVKSAVIPAGVYDGVDYEVQTLSTYQGLQVDMSFSQDLVYRMWKAMWEEEADTWKNAYQIGADNNIPELTLKAASTPLHAGTVQYLTELGYEVPQELIPEEYVPVNP
ncbi:TAXI family TRAP transporter solute-binding subunit [Enterocloster lavalensis]|uniref:TAXI family TRAP transporter solute-binding subunit n=1 Tax=Enterocloster lavalensis TaxID=460384 RepID=UPI0023F13243|nr:TAXI family TRAP transporter solute-binding subunit [Enterocloster lavalensis]